MINQFKTDPTASCGLPGLNGIRNTRYSKVMAMELDDIINCENGLNRDKIAGATMAFVNQDTYDYSKGSYFWDTNNFWDPKIGIVATLSNSLSPWGMYARGTTKMTCWIGGTTFFKYDPNKFKQPWP